MQLFILWPVSWSKKVTSNKLNIKGTIKTKKGRLWKGHNATGLCGNIPKWSIFYKARDMFLHLDSYTAYLTMPEERCFYSVIFYLSDWPYPRPVKPTSKIDVPIRTECKTILNVVSSAAEAETCGTFNNGKTAIIMWSALIALHHNQPVTLLKTENSTTEGFLNSDIKTKR